MNSVDQLPMTPMEMSDHNRVSHDSLNNTSPAFSRRLVVAMDGVQPKTMQSKLKLCIDDSIRHNGTVVYRSLLTAAHNCVERLDATAARTLRYIDRLSGRRKTDLTSSFNTLNRILPLCAEEANHRTM